MSIYEQIGSGAQSSGSPYEDIGRGVSGGGGGVTIKPSSGPKGSSFLSNLVGDPIHAALGFFPSLYHLGAAASHDVGEALPVVTVGTHGVGVRSPHPKRATALYHTAVEPLGQDPFVKDIRALSFTHPLRNPGAAGYIYAYVTGGKKPKSAVMSDISQGHVFVPLVDALGIASFGGARIAALAAVPERMEAVTANQAIKRAIIRGQHSGDLQTLTVRDTPTGEPIVVRTLPRNTYQAGRMKAVDTALKWITHEAERHYGNLPGKAHKWGSFPVVGESARAARAVEKVENEVKLAHLSDPRLGEYQRAFSALDKHQRVALNTLGQVPKPDDLEAWKGILGSQDSAQALLVQLNHPEMRKWYDDPANRDSRKAKKFARAVEATKGIVAAREDILFRTGALTPEAAAAAAYGPTRVTRGAEFETEQTYNQRLADIDSTLGAIGSDIGATVKGARTISPDPGPPPGYVRLYRGEGPEGKRGIAHAYRDQGLIPDKESGNHWFTTERATAEAHAADGGSLWHVDVPARVANDFREVAGSVELPGHWAVQARKVGKSTIHSETAAAEELARAAGRSSKARGKYRQVAVGLEEAQAEASKLNEQVRTVASGSIDTDTLSDLNIKVAGTGPATNVGRAFADAEQRTRTDALHTEAANLRNLIRRLEAGEVDVNELSKLGVTIRAGGNVNRYVATARATAKRRLAAAEKKLANETPPVVAAGLEQARLRALGVLHDRVGPAYEKLERKLAAAHALEREMARGEELALARGRSASAIRRAREARIQALQSERAALEELVSLRHSMELLRSEVEAGGFNRLVGGGTPEEIAADLEATGLPTYSADALHITTPSSAAAIRQKGFNVRRGKGLGGDDYGPGIYLADEARDMGAYWRSQIETKGERGIVDTEAMRAKVALAKPFRYGYIRFNRVGDEIGRMSPREALAAQRPDLLEAFDAAVKTLTEKRALGKVLRENGYDGLIVEHKAGDEIVAFNADRVAFEGGRPSVPLVGRPQPWYVPNVPGGSRETRESFSKSGGRTPPTSDVKGSQRILFRMGQLALHPDLLTPSFMRAVAFDAKLAKHEAVKALAMPIAEGEHLPANMEWVREVRGERIPFTLSSEGEHLAEMEKVFPEDKPLTIGRDGSGNIAVDAEGRRLAVSRTLAKKLEVEVKQASLATKWLWQKPTDVWRALVLNLRIPWLINNIVGNQLLFALRFAGIDGLKAYVGMLSEPARTKLFRMASSEKHLSREDMAEVFSGQVRGTFIDTSTPYGVHGRARRRLGYAGAGLAPLDRRTEQALRRAAVETVLRGSPEVRAIYKAMPKQERSMRQAMIQAAKGSDDLKRLANTEANRALGDYLTMSPAEQGALRRVAPFYGWYREILRIATHAVVDTPVRVALLSNLAILEEQRQQDIRGLFPSYLQGSIAIGGGPPGTQRVLTTRALNPFSTVADEARILQFLTGGGGRAGADAALGVLNPLGVGAAKYTLATSQGDSTDLSYEGGIAGALGGKVGPFGAIAGSVFGGLPYARAISPPPPSRLYPTRDRNELLWQLIGDIRRDPNLQQAHLYGAQNR